jgi:hypothetical protein
VFYRRRSFIEQLIVPFTSLQVDSDVSECVCVWGGGCTEWFSTCPLYCKWRREVLWREKNVLSCKCRFVAPFRAVEKQGLIMLITYNKTLKGQSQQQGANTTSSSVCGCMVIVLYAERYLV